MRANTTGALGLSVSMTLLLAAPPLLACGAFFPVKADAPVQQRGLRVLYVQQPTSVVAHIQIAYDGPGEAFAWLMPLPSVPEVAVSSDVIFFRLDEETHPTAKNSTAWAEPEPPCNYPKVPCDLDPWPPEVTKSGPPDVKVEVLQSGSVGPYEHLVLSSSKAADVVQWLKDKGYAIPTGTAPLLQVYAEQEFKFLALRLKKGKGAGDLVTIPLTLAETSPCLPLRLASLSAGKDLPTVVWIEGPHRAVPKNFLHVQPELSRVNWLNPYSNYGRVLADAIDAAGGHAFATEAALEGMSTGKLIGSEAWDDEDFANILRLNLEKLFPTNAVAVGELLVQRDLPPTAQLFALLRKHAPRPDSLKAVSEQELYGCLWCSKCESECDGTRAEMAKVKVDGRAFISELREVVTTPAAGLYEASKAAAEAHGREGNDIWLTRLALRVDGAALDRDAVFAFNPDLPELMPWHGLGGVYRPVCEGDNWAKKAVLDTDAGEVMVKVPQLKADCAEVWGMAMTFAEAADPPGEGGGPIARHIEVLDEGGPPLRVHPDDVNKVDAALANAILCEPSLTADFVAGLVKMKAVEGYEGVAPFEGCKEPVEPDADGAEVADTDAGGAKPEDGDAGDGCSAGQGNGSPGGVLVVLVLLLAGLVLRPGQPRSGVHRGCQPIPRSRLSKPRGPRQDSQQHARPTGLSPEVRSGLLRLNSKSPDSDRIKHTAARSPQPIATDSAGHSTKPPNGRNVPCGNSTSRSPARKRCEASAWALRRSRSLRFQSCLSAREPA